jgi:DMSO/TMAO reductase YedYZ molybdopterin-dependent catalytic subunit
MSRAAGALAAAAQLAVAELAAAALPGARGPVAGAVRRIIDTTPGPAVDVGVAMVETADKALLKTGFVGGSIAAGAVADTRTRPALALLGAATGVAAASCEDARTVPTLVAATAGTGAGVGARALLGPTPDRRRLAGAAGLVAVTALAATALDRARLRRLDAKRLARPLAPAATTPPPEHGLPIAGISPLYTPVGSFYVTDIAARAPRVDPDAWRLRIGGMVDQPLELALDDLEQIGLVELDATLVCVHNPVGGDRIGTARWLGVPLSRLLERAGAQPGAEQLVARSVDGFSAGVPVERIRSGAPALLAVGMNGEALPFEHGFPARLLVPGLWGADANTKWVTELELTTWEAVSDYWDSRGWPRQAPRVQPAARIDVPVNRSRVRPGTVTVAGVAWAPPEGVEGVEVEIDGGPWEAAELGPETAPTMWRQWSFAWQAAPGEHVVRVRALGRRRRQPDGAEPPYPVGARGYHTHRLSVDAAKRPGRQPVREFLDDLTGRLVLAGRGAAAWHDRGFPPPPRFPAPTASPRRNESFSASGK